MNTLYSFGCSFTEDFTYFCEYENRNTNSRTRYVFDFLNGRKPISWSLRLSEKLNYLDKNYGAMNALMDKKTFPLVNGNSNESIFYNFIQTSHLIKKNDIVIIEWTFLNRALFIDYKKNHFANILPNQYIENYDNKLFDELMLSNSHPLKMNIISVYEKIINEIAELKGFKIFYWSIDENYYKFHLKKHIKNEKILFIEDIKNCNGLNEFFKKNKVTTIKEDTNQTIDDTHFSENGCLQLAELMYSHISSNGFK